jgi:enoyl-CoA hydratase
MIEREDRDGVTTVALAHGKVNALDLELNRAVTATFRQLADDDEVTAVVLTGTRTSFSAGVDLRRASTEGRGYIQEFIPALVDAFESVFRFPKPVVAAVNGHAIAGGCVLACAADLSMMAAGGGRIGVTELAVGVPFPTAALEIVRFAVGTPTANALVLAADTYTPEAAAELGLIDEVVPAHELHDRAQEAARRLADIPTATFRHTKRQLRRDAFARIDDHAAQEDPDTTRMWASPPMAEAMSTFLARVANR